jgi:primosomal protein N' (replication factor Y)
LAIFFPSARVKRMDLDSTRSKNAYYNIITDFEDGNVDILVGTQMVTKGLDFDNVALVGILNADNMLQFPDFRAYERSFQLMAQVSGRAGRKNKRGKVIIQTYNPNHSIIKDVIMNNFVSMYTNELLDRRNFHYPPFYRLIEITLKHADSNILSDGAKNLVKNLKNHFGNRVLGPETPAIARVRNLYIRNILIKVEKEASTAQVKQFINDELINFHKTTEYKSIRVSMDVDPI